MVHNCISYGHLTRVLYKKWLNIPILTGGPADTPSTLGILLRKYDAGFGLTIYNFFKIVIVLAIYV